MNEKEQFIATSYEKLKFAILSIDDKFTNEIYALSLWYYIDNDDPRLPKIEFSFNTKSNVTQSIAQASDENEAKWNFAFWLQNTLTEIGGENDELLKNWFKTTPYYYSDIDKSIARRDDKFYDRILVKASEFCDGFIEEIILLVHRLFSDKVIEKKFGQNIPILIHELEYYDKPINWTLRANPNGLVDDFVNWTRVG